MQIIYAYSEQSGRAQSIGFSNWSYNRLQMCNKKSQSNTIILAVEDMAYIQGFKRGLKFTKSFWKLFLGKLLHEWIKMSESIR